MQSQETSAFVCENGVPLDEEGCCLIGKFLKH
jgi:hypothetical protein